MNASDTVNASDRAMSFNVISVKTMLVSRKRERQRNSPVTPETSSFVRTFPSNSLHVEMFIEFTRFRDLHLRHISAEAE